MKHRISTVVAALIVAFAAPTATAVAAGPAMTVYAQDTGPLGTGFVVQLTNTTGRVIGGCLFDLNQGGRPATPSILRAGLILTGSTWMGMFAPVPPGKYEVIGRCFEPFVTPADFAAPKFFWRKVITVTAPG